MKEQKYKKTDGTEGVSYKLEKGDIIYPAFGQPKMSGQYNSFTIGAKFNPDDEEVIYVRLTNSQGQKLMSLGDVTGKKVVAYGYKNKFGDQVGVNVE